MLKTSGKVQFILEIKLEIIKQFQMKINYFADMVFQ